MATPLMKSWTPNTTYEFNLIIDDQDYSNDMTRLAVRSSVAAPYENVLIELLLDPLDIIANKIYGQSKIKLTIILKGEVQFSDQRIELELLFLRIKSDYHTKKHTQTMLGEQIERTSIQLETLVREPYITMNTQVNGIYYGVTPEQIITDLVSQTNAKLEYDTNGKNSLVIDQFLIPPSTLYRTINYLDATYGVFDGILSTSCSIDNIFQVQNISKKIQADQAFTLYQLATDLDQSKILESNDPSQFYTTQPIELVNRGNSILSGIAPSITYITKPSNQLFGQIPITVKEYALKYGITDKKQPIIYDEEAISTSKRKIFTTNKTGYDNDQSFAIADSMQDIQDVSMLSVQLNHNLPILNLLRTGSSVNFKPQVSDYKPLSGFYVLKAADIGWNRSPKMWDCWAKLYLMRSNIITS